MQAITSNPFVAIACGGTGGHLFPGLAIAEALQQRECKVVLFISPKEVDQVAAKGALDMEVITLPVVALSLGGMRAFARGFWQAYRLARKLFRARCPQAVLAMGSFASAPPVLAGKACGAVTFVHEANARPGRANRWLAPWVDEVFVHFPTAADRLRSSAITVTGMPVRSQFEPMDGGACRLMLGLDARGPVLLVMGGSQGASAINDLVVRSLPLLVERMPALQYLHLSGAREEPRVRAAYATHQRRAVVRAFLTEMEMALNAATMAVSRAGASSLAEFAALRLPALLIPYPSAANNHQFYNALAFVESGAARMVAQRIATPQILTQMVSELMPEGASRTSIQNALAQWHRPRCAEEIADHLCRVMRERQATVAAHSAVTVSKPVPVALATTPSRKE
jgi:UDP-N-acetylglucosamine--N-acetylmuramyl-(pentapeptide) pyrophosphoryl-undecaprenol N-acetylglucosamine transferase